MPRQQVGEIQLYYEITGQGPVVLLIHGLGSSHHNWEKQLDEFSRHYRVVSIDLRGHGLSDKPPGPYSIDMFANDTADLFRALDIDAAHVIGVSLGGMVAFQLAVNAPELVRSLVIVNATPEFKVQTIKERLNVLQRRLVVRLLGIRRMGKILSTRLFPEVGQQELRDRFVERWAENDKQAYWAAMQAIPGWGVARTLPDISCPTLFVAADQDYTSVEHKQAYVDRMPDAQLSVVKNSRHALPVERPEEFNALVLGFLSRIDTA